MHRVSRGFRPGRPFRIVLGAPAVWLGLLALAASPWPTYGSPRHRRAAASLPRSSSVHSRVRVPVRAPSRIAKKSAKELRTDLHSVKSQISQTRRQIRETKKREVKITVEIESVESRLLATEARLEVSRDRLKRLRAEDEVLRQRIAETEARLLARKAALSRRVRENYIRGRTTYVQVLLHSSSVQDYLARSYYVERLVDSDIRLVAGIRADRRQLAEDKRKLDQQTAEELSLEASLQTEQESYRADAERKRDLLHDVQETRESMEEALEVLEQSSREIEARIRAMERTPQGRARMLQAWTGHFIRPAAGPITSGFGMRHHPILGRDRMHTGVDIGAGYGAPIHAAAGGTVIFSGYQRGYGNTMIIDHGGGVTTLYGHCSRLGVSEGQTVRQGEVIGNVGSTGLSTGPHLHFEVRRNGTPVNPL